MILSSSYRRVSLCLSHEQNTGEGAQCYLTVSRKALQLEVLGYRRRGEGPSGQVWSWQGWCVGTLGHS